jgi:hypothetical protein
VTNGILWRDRPRMTFPPRVWIMRYTTEVIPQHGDRRLESEGIPNQRLSGHNYSTFVSLREQRYGNCRAPSLAHRLASPPSLSEEDERIPHPKGGSSRGSECPVRDEVWIGSAGP